MMQRVEIKIKKSEDLWKSQVEERMDSKQNTENEVPAQMLKYRCAGEFHCKSNDYNCIKR